MKRRLKASGMRAVYHCISRTVGGEFLLGDEEKAVLRKQLWQVSDFCGVEVLTYCIMSNHFHILVRVPDSDSVTVSDEELLRRYCQLYPEPTIHQQARLEVLEAKLAAGGESAEAFRQSMLSRMHDVSVFMQILKQRFSIWYNRSRGRFGTVWAERFRSVLVQGHGHPLYTVARYIDLNPVRAEMVEDPRDYPYCGYSDALGGNRRAISGICEVVRTFSPNLDENQVFATYRMGLFGQGQQSAPGKRGKILRESALKVLAEKGRLTLAEALFLRIRYFSDGAIIGTAEFVKAFMRRNERNPARLKGADWGGLCSERDLKKDRLG